MMVALFAESAKVLVGNPYMTTAPVQPRISAPPKLASQLAGSQAAIGNMSLFEIKQLS